MRVQFNILENHKRELQYEHKVNKKLASSLGKVWVVWEGIREFLEVPNKRTGSFFGHMVVH